MQSLTPSEQHLVDAARFHRTNQPLKWQSSNKDSNKLYRTWYEIGYEHLIKQTLPRIRSRNEHLVQCWPTYFLWGQGLAHKRFAWEDRSYLHKLGTFGTGYTCLTLSRLYIVALKDLTKRYPLVEGGATGFVTRVFGRMGGEEDSREPITSDRTYDLDVKSILDAQVIQDVGARDAVAVRTANEQILVYRHFTHQDEEIALAIQMVLNRKMAQALGVQNQVERIESTASNSLKGDNAANLQELKRLFDLGLISDQEYSSKKAEILSRL